MDSTGQPSSPTTDLHSKVQTCPCDSGLWHSPSAMNAPILSKLMITRHCMELRQGCQTHFSQSIQVSGNTSTKAALNSAPYPGVSPLSLCSCRDHSRAPVQAQLPLTECARTPGHTGDSTHL